MLLRRVERLRRRDHAEERAERVVVPGRRPDAAYALDVDGAAEAHVAELGDGSSRRGAPSRRKAPMAASARRGVGSKAPRRVDGARVARHRETTPLSRPLNPAERQRRGEGAGSFRICYSSRR